MKRKRAYVAFRATQEEREALEKLARARRTSLSQTVRDAIARAAAELDLRGGGGQHAEEVQGEK